MHKVILFLFFFIFSVNLKALDSQKFQLVANKIYTKDNITTATGDVVIYSSNYYLSANKIIFNQNNQTFELFDNVLIIKDNKLLTLSNYGFLDIKNNKSQQFQTFLFEKDTNLWINSKNLEKEQNIIIFENPIFSFCDCDDPAWTTKSSSLKYDSEKMWVQSYNTIFYVKNFPIFYTPFLAFSTDNSRKSGFLTPTIGYSNSEGFKYVQPIYFAFKDNQDLEILPQIRTKRGEGSYFVYRYAGPYNSSLNLKTGYFKEKDSFLKNENLNNDQIYGFDFDYSRKFIFSNSQNNQDGFFLSAKYLNDIAYKNLDDSTNKDQKIESKLNYFFTTNNYYTGIYSKYYIDTSRDSSTGKMISNKETIQEIPQIHLHSYNKNPFSSLIYSTDFKFYNYSRQKGLAANIYDLNIPISYNQYLMDDFLYFNLENKTMFSKYEYKNYNKDYIYFNGSTSNKFKDASLVQNKTTFSIGSDLIKPYESFLHTVNSSINFVIPKNIITKGDLYGITVTKKDDELKYNELSVFPTIEDVKYLNFNINQSFYSKNTYKQIINYRINQLVSFDEFNNQVLEDFENYLRINYDYGFISGKMIYNFYDKEFIENSLDNYITINNVSFGIGYYKSKETNNALNYRESLESYRINTSYNFFKDYSLRYYENYNIKDKIRNKQGIGINIDDICWNLDLYIEKEIYPRSTGNYSSQENTILYAMITIKPIGAFDQKFNLLERLK